jgi:hypothetical protein
MCKKVSLILATFALILFSVNSLASHEVDGYYRNNGTYVEPHQSMDPYESRSTGMSYRDNVLVPRDESADSSNH